MSKVFIIRLGEIFLKGKNKSYFEALLQRNIKQALTNNNLECNLLRGRNRFYIEDFIPDDEQKIKDTLLLVFGIHSISIAQKLQTCPQDDFAQIKVAAINQIKDNGYNPDDTFRVTVNRADKRLEKTSAEIAADIGAYIVGETVLKVKLEDFDIELCVDIRENGVSFVYSKTYKGAGGLPVGCSGQGMLMLSGGIDSPVAAYMMAKRGLKIKAVHFSSPPYTSEMAKDKVVKLKRICENYCLDITLFIVPFTEIQLSIHQKCKAEYLVTIMRRFMMRIAQQLAQKHDCGVIITGESLGQVASQTIQGLHCTDAVATIPVLRPLIGLDKQEIVQIAKKIETYQTSILPYEDCCTIFVPKKPVIKPQLSEIEKDESILDVQSLVDEALSNTIIVE